MPPPPKPPPPPAVNVQQVRQLLASGRHSEGLELARRLVFLSPNDGDCLHTLADALMMSGVADQATHYYERAIKAAPTRAAIRNNFGLLLMQRNQLERAAAELQEAIRLDPDYPGPYSNLVLALSSLRQGMRALGVARDGLARFPADDALARNSAIVLMNAGLADEAVRALRRARDGGASSGALQGLLAHAMNYAPGLSADEVFREHAELGRRMTGAIPPDSAPHANVPDPDRRLRIGYLSSAFCNHSAGHFLESILVHHDRERFEICCYSNGWQQDELTARVRPLASVWVDAHRLNHRALADRVRADRIDIAVDLQGHTSTGMLPALCFKPAPVQATYLGYPNTTGLPAIDHRLVDARTDPEGAERLSSERLVRLDPCFLCYTPPPHAPEPAAAPPSGASGVVTFGSFNTNGKLSAPTLDLWATVLLAVPGSRLLLKNMIMSDASLADFRRSQLSERGVDPSRVELLPETPERGEHMRMYDRVDIALDPFPYNGTTTTVEAMWMGVPVVTLAGDSHVSRVGVSLLFVAGLADLIAATPEDYVRIAAGLAADQGRLAELRGSLRGRLRASPLCDASGFTRRLETAYRGIWAKWCASRRA